MMASTRSSSGSVYGSYSPTSHMQYSMEQGIPMQLLCNNQAPLLACNLVYLGSDVPLETNFGPEAAVQPMRKIFKDKRYRNTLYGIPVNLAVFNSGFVVKILKGPSTGMYIWYPIQNLHLAAGYRCEFASNKEIWTTVTYHPLYCQVSRHAQRIPPLISLILRETQGKKVLFCHTFASNSVHEVNRLVNLTRMAYNRKEGWTDQISDQQYNVLQHSLARRNDHEIPVEVQNHEQALINPNISLLSLNNFNHTQRQFITESGSFQHGMPGFVLPMPQQVAATMSQQPALHMPVCSGVPNGSNLVPQSQHSTVRSHTSTVRQSILSHQQEDAMSNRSVYDIHTPIRVHTVVHGYKGFQTSLRMKKIRAEHRPTVPTDTSAITPLVQGEDSTPSPEPDTRHRPTYQGFSTSLNNPRRLSRITITPVASSPDTYNPPMSSPSVHQTESSDDSSTPGINVAGPSKGVNVIRKMENGEAGHFEVHGGGYQIQAVQDIQVVEIQKRHEENLEDKRESAQESETEQTMSDTVILASASTELPEETPNMSRHHSRKGNLGMYQPKYAVRKFETPFATKKLHSPSDDSSVASNTSGSKPEKI